MNDFVEDRSVLSRPARAPDQTARYGELPEHIADVYLGDARAVERPLIVFIHGGFWRPPIDRMHARHSCETLANAGWSVASIEYRRVPGEPDKTIDDVTAAVRAMPTATAQHNGKAIVMGHSAGGHLCLYAAAVRPTPALIGAVALAPAADLQRCEELNLGDGAARAFLGVPAKERADLDPARLPTPALTVAIVHGKQDAIVPVAVAHAYAERHPATHIEAIDDCGHFAVIDPLTPAWAAVIAQLERMSAS